MREYGESTSDYERRLKRERGLVWRVRRRMVDAGIIGAGGLGCLAAVVLVLVCAALPTAFAVFVAVMVARMLGVDV